MNQEQAFLEDVIAHPDDDAPRLVFADWLDDRGDADRAELIRVQCELSRSPDETRRRDLLAREEALLNEHGERWAEPLRGLVDEWAFVRGFIEKVALDMNYPFFDRLEKMFSLVPIRALRLKAADFRPSPLLQAEYDLARLRSLDLDLENVHDRALRELFSSPGLRNLTSLLVEIESPVDATQVTLKALAKAPALANLTEFGLHVGYNPGHLPDPVVQALVRSPHLAKVTRLYLPLAHLSLTSARVLGSAPGRAPLTHLHLSSAALSQGAHLELERGPNLARLERLDVRDAIIDRNDFIGPLDQGPEMERLLARFGAGVVVHEGELADCGFPRWQGRKWRK